jgi:hypothetical protein
VDTTADGVVDFFDWSVIKAASGQTISSLNFRADVTANGLINASDVALAKSNSGASLPLLPFEQFTARLRDDRDVGLTSGHPPR